MFVITEKRLYQTVFSETDLQQLSYSYCIVLLYAVVDVVVIVGFWSWSDFVPAYIHISRLPWEFFFVVFVVDKVCVKGKRRCFSLILTQCGGSICGGISSGMRYFMAGEP